MRASFDGAVVGLDIGSSTVKACLFDLSGEAPRLLDERAVECPLLRPCEGWVEHDLAALGRAVKAVLGVAPAGGPVGWSGAMHGLVLLDGQGRPLADALSWADGRSGAQAQALWENDPGAYVRTGTPLHPMAWPAKLLWVREQRPELWKATARVTDLKSYLWECAMGQIAPLDLSSASATGLWNSLEGKWDLRLCSWLDHVQLPAVQDQHRAEWRGRKHYLGGADGPLGNLGLGAVGEGRVAISLGTSGAVRRFRKQRGKVCPGLFLYALGELGWVEGGAISNGGSVMEWLRQQRPLSVDEILRQAAQSPPGANGLQVYPYFAGERAPFWRPDVRSQITGWTQQHTFADLARATLEGVAYCLRRLLDLMEASEQPLRCTGGLFASDFWTELLASVSGRALARGTVAQATALGAALSTLPDALERSRRLPVGPSVIPNGASALLYQEHYDGWLEGDPNPL
jgi:gluconokinase